MVCVFFCAVAEDVGAEDDCSPGEDDAGVAEYAADDVFEEEVEHG